MKDGRALVAVTGRVAALAALPVLAVVARRIARQAPARRAPADTVLARYVGNGRARWRSWASASRSAARWTGWRSRARFPGGRWFEWALLLPLAMPAYVMAYAYTDLDLQYAGPVQNRFAAARSAGRAATTGFPTSARRPAPPRCSCSRSTRTSTCSRGPRVPRTPQALVEAARTLGLDRRRAFWRSSCRSRRTGDRGRHRARADGDAGRLRDRRLLRVDTFTTGIYRARFTLGDRAASAQLARDAAGLRAARGGARARLAGTAQRRQQAPAQSAADRARGSAGGRARRSGAVLASRSSSASRCRSRCSRGILSPPADLALSARFAEWAWNGLRVASRRPLAVAVVFAVLASTRCATRAGGPTRGERVLARDAVPGPCSLNRRAAAAGRGRQLAHRAAIHRATRTRQDSSHRHHVRARLRLPRPLTSPSH